MEARGIPLGGSAGLVGAERVGFERDGAVLATEEGKYDRIHGRVSELRKDRRASIEDFQA